LLVMCEDRYAAVSAVNLVLNQRLTRRLCQHCHGTGCAACLSTGYRGRVPIVEWLKVDDSLRAQIRDQGPGVVQPENSIQSAARELLRQKLSDESEIKRVLGC